MKKMLVKLFSLTLVLTLALSGMAYAQQQQPIIVGVLAPQTGVYASGGADARVAVEMAFDEIGNQINGRPIVLLFEDSAANPQIAQDRLASVVSRGAQIVLGPLSSGAGEAVKAHASRYPNVTIIIAGAASENITMRGTEPNIFRTTYTGSQVMFPFGKFAYEELGIRRVVTLAEDYAFPFSQIAGFVSSFILAGGEVVERVWVTLGTHDYSSLIPRLRILANQVDAFFIALGGTDAINFLQQARDAGLLDLFKQRGVQILGGTIMVDPTVLLAAGELLEGVYTGSHFSQALTHEEFVKFDTEFRARTNNRTPSLFAADYYIAAQAAIEALKAVNGNVEDQAAFREALAKVDIMTPRGPLKFDSYRQAVLNTYITQVQFVDGEYKNVVVHTYPDTTQFGPFDPEWYESQLPPNRERPTVQTILNAKLAE